MTKETSFPTAMREFFGLKPGETLKDFLVELRGLNDKDRAYFRALLEGAGYKITG